MVTVAEMWVSLTIRDGRSLIMISGISTVHMVRATTHCLAQRWMRPVSRHWTSSLCRWESQLESAFPDKPALWRDCPFGHAVVRVFSWILQLKHPNLEDDQKNLAQLMLMKGRSLLPVWTAPGSYGRKWLLWGREPLPAERQCGKTPRGSSSSAPISSDLSPVDTRKNKDRHIWNACHHNAWAC